MACLNCDYTTPYRDALRRHVCGDGVQPGVEGVADELIASLSETPKKPARSLAERLTILWPKPEPEVKPTRSEKTSTHRRAVTDRQPERKVSESAKAPTLWGEHPPLNRGIAMRSVAALQDALVSPFPWRRRLGGALRLFRLLRSVAATALFCTVLIHVAVFAGILIYVGVQEGAPNGVLPMVADTFTSAREAYVEAWREVANRR